jgi:hypothetical protein
VKVTFTYDKNKDIWNLLNWGAGSHNRPTPTIVYKQLLNYCRGKPVKSNTAEFIEKYFVDNNIEIQTYIAEYQKDWDIISSEYFKRADEIFNLRLPTDVTAYLSINNRCPYNILDHFFCVTVPAPSRLRQTVMHELLHFYTWYKFGAWEKKLGRAKYNDYKEALTVLLNLHFKDLLPEGVEDLGYPQHVEIRNKIKYLWSQTNDITNIWEIIVNEE